MKKIIALLIILSAFIINPSQAESIQSPKILALNNSADILQKAFENGTSNLQIEGTGIVLKLLKDDRKGIKHQKFLLKLESGKSILIAHNIDLSSRIKNLKVGDRIDFYGEYEWNNKGGVVHWTHRDPSGRHINGWLKHLDKIYQ